MLAFYLPVKAVHVAAILTSGGLFALRGAAVLAGARWAMATPVRWLTYAVDTVLLTAALMLLTMLRLNPFAVPWLTTKLALIVAYVVFGSFALKRAGSPRARALSFVAAAACFGLAYTVARAHHPLGLLRGLAP